MSEDKEFLQQQLIEAKSLNRNTMFELDQYKQKHGDIDVLDQPAWKGLTSDLGTMSPNTTTGGLKKNIFEPTALPEQHDREKRNNNKDMAMVSDPSSAGLNTSDLISGVNTGGLLAAKQAGSEIAKLQIQYNLMLKENNLLREK